MALAYCMARCPSPPARRRDPLAGLRLGFLDALVGRDTCADERRGLLGVEASGCGRLARIREQILREASVLRVAAELRFGTDRLPRPEAIFAMTAGRIQPWHADAIALFDDRHASAHGGTVPMAPRPGMNGSAGLSGQSPLAAWRLVWQTPHARVLTTIWPGPGVGMSASRRYEGLAKLLDEGCVHLLCHRSFLSVCLSFVLCVRRAGQAAAFAPNPRTASIIVVSTAAASP